MSETFQIIRKIQPDIGVHAKYRYSCPILRKLQFSRQIFEKHSSMKFHENPSSGSQVVTWGRTDRQA